MGGLTIACPACGKDIVDIPPDKMFSLDTAVEALETMMKKAGALVVDGEAYCDQICHETVKRGGKRMVPC